VVRFLKLDISASKKKHKWSIFGRLQNTQKVKFKIQNFLQFRGYCIGLSIRNIPDGSCVANSPNCYAIRDGDDYCFLAGKVHEFEWPKGTTRPTWNGQGNVAGCGLVLSPDNKLAIFFTLNGILMGQSRFWNL
jgi:hypothetical protein